MLSYGLLCKPYFYYSGDTKLDETYLEVVAGEVQTILHECHMQEDQLPSHTSLEELLTLPVSIQEKMLLMHYVDDYVLAGARDQFHVEQNFVWLSHYECMSGRMAVVEPEPAY